MSIAFKKLFNVKMAHNFYINGVTKDFDIVPFPETQQVLANNKLVYRIDDTGLRVLYRTKENSANPFFAFTNLDLKFALTLKSRNEFPIFSDLDESPSKKFKAGNLVYFKNDSLSPTTAALSYSLIDELRPAVFSYNFPQTSISNTATGQIKIFNETNVDVTPASPPPTTGIAGVPDPNAPSALYRFSYAVDFSKMPAGWYKFTTKVTGEADQDRIVYIDSTLAAQNVFGIVKITVNNYTAFPVNREYIASFVRRNSIWRYVVVLQSDAVNVTDTVEVLDKGDDVLPPYPNVPYVFTFVSNGMLGDLHTRIFDSAPPNDKIPFFQRAKKGIYIRRTPTSPPGPAEIIKNNINNASWNVVSADGTDFGKTVIYVYV